MIMKKILLYILAAAIPVLTVGCEKPEEKGEGGGDKTPQEYFWHFSVQNADASQPIGLFVRDFDGSLTNQEIHLDAASGASFEIKTDYPLTTGGKVYAYAPYASGNDKHTAITLSIPAEQVSGAVAMPKVAVPVVLSEPTQEAAATLNFFDLAGTLEVKVYSTEATGEKVTGIAFESPDPLAGNFVFNAKAADPNQPATVAISGYTEKKVSASGSFALGTDPEQAGGLTLALAPGKYNGNVTVTTDANSYGVVLEEPVTVMRGEKTSVTVRIAPLNSQEDSGNTEDFEGGELETGNIGTKTDGSISILAIGNSFSIDAMQHLYGILAKLGYTDIYLGNLYIAGCTLETHAANVTGNLQAYRYYTNSTGEWSHVEGYSSISALKSRKWDYVTVQQASKFSGMPATYEPYLSTVLQEIKTDRPDAQVGWHMTWAYKGNYTSANFGNYSYNQMTMYNAIVSAVQSVIVPKKDDIDFVIPVRTAIQNLRTSFIGDHLNRNDSDPNNQYTTDGSHLSFDLGRLTAAMMWARQITGKSVMGIKYVPSGYTITDEQFNAIWDAVEKAYQKPFEVTVSAYPGDTPPPTPEPEPEPEGTLPTDALKVIFTGAGYSLSDYEAVPIKWTHFAYWNTVNNGSVLQTQSNQTSANLKKFSATQMFDKTTLPVGSVIVCKDGYQYRPDAMVSLTEKTASASRRANVTVNGSNSVVVADDSWWNDKETAWNYVGFNLAKNGVSDLDEAGHKELEGVFAIFKPKQ